MFCVFSIVKSASRPEVSHFFLCFCSKKEEEMANGHKREHHTDAKIGANESGCLAQARTPGINSFRNHIPGEKIVFSRELKHSTAWWPPCRTIRKRCSVNAFSECHIHIHNCKTNHDLSDPEVNKHSRWVTEPYEKKTRTQKWDFHTRR